MKNPTSASIKNARHQAKKQGGQIFYSGNVTKHHIKSKGKDERILMISQLFISYYSKKAENTNTNYWVDLKSITVQKKDKNTFIKLSFDQNEVMMFEYSNILKIDSIINETIKYMSTGQDIKFEGIDAPVKFSILPRSIFNILMSHILLNNNSPPKPLKSSLRMICRLQSKVVGFMPEMVDQYFPFLLRAIVNSNYIESFRIPELNNNTDVYNCLSDFLKSDKNSYSSIIHLQISRQDMKNFKSFCDSLSKEKSTSNRISGLTFSDNEFDQESIKLISESIISSKLNGGFEINSIKFENSANDGVNFVDSFFPNLTPIKTSNSPLKLFSLNRMKIADISQLISLLQGIRVLSLTYMGLEISSIFEAISNTKMDDLSFLNVSGNFLNETANNINKLPSSLQRLDMNEVDFLVKNPKSEKGSALIDTIFAVLNKKWDLLFYLSISHVLCHKNDEGSFPPEQALQNLYSKLKKIKNNSCDILKGLSFNANYVNDDFFEFVKKCRNLKSLYLNFCIASDSPCLKSFCNTLETSLPKLNVLSVRGDVIQNRVLGDKFPTFCKSIKKCKSLQCLIVADNMIGTKGLESLSKLFEPTIEGEMNEDGNKSDKKQKGGKDNKNCVYDTLSSLSFDNCNAGNLKPIIGIALKAASLGRPILIDYPTQEVWRLKQSNLTDKPAIRELRERLETCFNNGIVGESQSTLKNDEDFKPIFEYWEKPFCERKVDTNDFFPEYLSTDVLGEIYSPDVAPAGLVRNSDTSESENDEEIKKKKSKNGKSNRKSGKDDSKSEDEKGSEDDRKKKKKKKKKKDDYSDDYDDQSEQYSDDDDEKLKKKKKKKYDDSEDDEIEEDRKKQKKKSKKKSKLDDETESDYDDNEYDDERSKKRKKKHKHDDESDDDSFNKKKKSSKKKQKFNNESDLDEDSNENDKKRKKSSNKKQKFDDEIDSDDDEYEYQSRKKQKSKKKKFDFDSYDESEDDDFRKVAKKSNKIKKKKGFNGSENDDDDQSEDDQKKKWRLTSQKTKRKKLDSDSYSDNDTRTKNKKSMKKRETYSDDYDQSDSDIKKYSKRHKKMSKMDDYDEYDEDNENESFPLSIDHEKEKEIVKNLKKKFSLNRLQDEIMNN